MDTWIIVLIVIAAVIVLTVLLVGVPRMRERRLERRRTEASFGQVPRSRRVAPRSERKSPRSRLSVHAPSGRRQKDAPAAPTSSTLT